ncbi:hypothetical protein Poli38472_003244 [Pythium oligandrum]|uniref:Uncharacterized protein n=1 Tax=Pythium oligandrum TaxID=41045 RepID=A0A8K1C6F7_PYTOL|nr:hypothetical protein Poli38472_003244 [Pythium oligandrum]|eukprot:TMW57319.1 hypothetical protein Poli38472_003244 [Pythium oligandrum]
MMQSMTLAVVLSAVLAWTSSVHGAEKRDHVIHMRVHKQVPDALNETLETLHQVVSGLTPTIVTDEEEDDGQSEEDSDEETPFIVGDIIIPPGANVVINNIEIDLDVDLDVDVDVENGAGGSGDSVEYEIES